MLDDYHVIEAPEIHQAIELLLQHLPTAMRLVLISRTMPPLRLARLQASGELWLVTQSDLRFTAGGDAPVLPRLVSASISPPARSGCSTSGPRAG